jgi:hypothetical protein
MTNDEKLKEIETLKAAATAETMSPEDLQHQREQAQLSQDLAEIKAEQQRLRGVKLAILEEVKKEVRDDVDAARAEVRELQQLVAAAKAGYAEMENRAVSRALDILTQRSALTHRTRQRDRYYIIAWSCCGALAVGLILIWVFRHAS